VPDHIDILKLEDTQTLSTMTQEDIIKALQEEGGKGMTIKISQGNDNMISCGFNNMGALS